VEIVLNALLRMLSLDFVYALFKDAVDSESREILRFAASHRLKAPASEIRATLRSWFNDADQKSLSPIRKRLGDVGVNQQRARNLPGC
jgi:hypothetical protein